MDWPFLPRLFTSKFACIGVIRGCPYFQLGLDRLVGLRSKTSLTVRTTQNLDKCAEFFGVLWIETKLPHYPHLDQGWAKPGNC